MVVGEALTGADFARIAALHVECIDDSLPALLGPAYAERLYRFLADSDREFLVCERVEGRLESACVVSEDPEGLQGRIARATLPALVPAALRACLTRRDFRRWLSATLTGMLQRDREDATHVAPEITYIFTNRDFRGRRLGARMIERTDALLRKHGRDRYWVQTLDTPTNRAITFYEENGFARAGVREEAGRRFVVFCKELKPRNRANETHEH